MIWGNDGWCYIPQLNIRRKFKETHTIQENWKGVIALPEYVEELTFSEYEKSFPQKTSIQGSHKTTRRPRAPRQQPPQP
jgi:hypothetical protein